MRLSSASTRATRIRASLAAAMLFTCASGAAAEPVGIHVSGQWLRALGGTIPAAGYFTLENDTAVPIRLIGAASPDCASLTMHQTMHQTVPSGPAGHLPPMQGAMEMMQPVDSLPVPPHGAVRFAPGSYHLMCEHPSPRVHAGGTISVSLRLEGAASLESRFAVSLRRPDQDKAASTLSP